VIPPSSNIPPRQLPTATARRPDAHRVPESTPRTEPVSTPLRRPTESRTQSVGSSQGQSQTQGQPQGRGLTLDIAAAFEGMTLTPQRDNRESVTSVTTVTSEGFTDYISDDSEDELQRQTKMRAEQAYRARVEEAEFREARRALESVDLQHLEQPRYQPPAGPPPQIQIQQVQSQARRPGDTTSRRPEWDSSPRPGAASARHVTSQSVELARPTDSRVQPSVTRNGYDHSPQPVPQTLTRSTSISGDSRAVVPYPQPTSTNQRSTGRRETAPSSTDQYNSSSYRGQSSQPRAESSWQPEVSRPGQPVSEILQYSRDQNVEQPSRSPRPPQPRPDPHQPDNSRSTDPYNGPRRGYPPYDRA
jgi:hypothetical protein